jgi:hypothetical protein
MVGADVDLNSRGTAENPGVGADVVENLPGMTEFGGVAALFVEPPIASHLSCVEAITVCASTRTPALEAITDVLFITHSILDFGPRLL